MWRTTDSNLPNLLLLSIHKLMYSISLAYFNEYLDRIDPIFWVLFSIKTLHRYYLKVAYARSLYFV